MFGPIDGDGDAACPPGAPPVRGAQAAVVVLAGGGGEGAAARLEATVQALLQRLGAAGDGVRGLFHAYVATVREF